MCSNPTYIYLQRAKFSVDVRETTPIWCPTNKKLSNLTIHNRWPDQTSTDDRLSNWNRKLRPSILCQRKVPSTVNVCHNEGRGPARYKKHFLYRTIVHIPSPAFTHLCPKQRSVMCCRHTVVIWYSKCDAGSSKNSPTATSCGEKRRLSVKAAPSVLDMIVIMCKYHIHSWK